MPRSSAGALSEKLPDDPASIVALHPSPLCIATFPEIDGDFHSVSPGLGNRGESVIAIDGIFGAGVDRVAKERVGKRGLPG